MLRDKRWHRLMESGSGQRGVQVTDVERVTVFRSVQMVLEGLSAGSWTPGGQGVDVLHKRSEDQAGEDGL